MRMTAVAEADHHVETEQKVTPLELFFDLVFVFAITQVTALMADEPTWAGLAKGMLVLSALWWAWASYSWLTNTVNAEEGATRAVMIAAMAATLVASLAVPGAFGSEALVFALAYTVVRLLHIVIDILQAPTSDVRAAIERMAPGFVVFCGLLIAASFFDGWVQGAIWCFATVVHVTGLWFTGVRGWYVSASHFAERHGLILIIALGESIVSIGVGAAGQDVDTGVILAASLGVLATSALWWAYFDVVAPVAERRLRRAQGEERARLARDSYTFLHLPMVAGIVLLALGVKKAIAHTHEDLELVPAVALCGGVALYLFALVAFRLRGLGTWNVQRVIAGCVCLALVPVAHAISALAALALVTAVLCALIAYEAIHFAEARNRIRHASE
jgi:low temperature requirement protein LtrA